MKIYSINDCGLKNLPGIRIQLNPIGRFPGKFSNRVNFREMAFRYGSSQEHLIRFKGSATGNGIISR